MVEILIEDKNFEELLLEESTEDKIGKIKVRLSLMISHMLKYKHKGNIQTNSWTATIMNNYNNICKLIKSKAIYCK